MNEWERFFDGYAPQYMSEVFTKNTLAEIGFLEELLQLPKGSSLLDMGCGAGRHSVELAKRGYRMTGVDLSAGMLAEARRAAEAAGVTVEWIQADATKFVSAKQFDAAVCLCEGAFGLVAMGDDSESHDTAILRNIFAALKPGARFVLTALNGLRVIRQYSQDDVRAGRFDPLTLAETHTMEWETPAGKQTVTVREKHHLPQELVRLCGEAGFAVEHVWGGTAGNWGRRPVQLDEIEIMIVARKLPNG
ncbi:MAG: methyltransferase domain-containing protein [Chloroflexi bacterium]|nr:methyltransferase domain-containing protein [Chloroflexota bacterium]